MVELLRTNDPVRLSWVMALLSDADIGSVGFDSHASIVEGSIGALPRRLMVIADDLARARYVLDTAGEAYDSASHDHA